MKFASVRLVTGDPASVDTLVSFCSMLLRDPDGNVVNVFSRPVAKLQEAPHAA